LLWYKNCELKIVKFPWNQNAGFVTTFCDRTSENQNHWAGSKNP